MDTNALFLTASRSKFRFYSQLGNLSVEDLWDLPLTSAKGANLDEIARALHKQLKESDSDISFVKPASLTKTKVEELQARFDVVKAVIDVKVAERDANLAAKDKAEKKQRLMEIISKKKDAELEGKSVEDLQAMLSAL
jgi:hypothetical protein